MRTYSTADSRCPDVMSARLHSEWSALAGQVGTVFSSRPSFGLNAPCNSNGTLRFVEVRRGGDLVAFAPLCVTSLGPVKIARPLGVGQGVPTELLAVDDDASVELWDAIAGLDALVFADSMVDDRNLRSLRRHPAFSARVVSRERVPLIQVPEGVSPRDLRSTKTLKRLRQYRNQLSRSGTPMCIEVIEDVEHLDQRWNDISTLAAAATERSRYVNFLRNGMAMEFLRAEAAAGRLIIAGLTVGGRWMAHDIGIRTGDRIEAWLTHHDRRVRRFEPGHQMIEWFVEAHDDLGVTVLDQGLGVNEIKKSWTNADYGVYAIAASPKSGLLAKVMIDTLMAWELSPAVAHARRIRRTRPALR